MTWDEFQRDYLDLLQIGQEFDLYGYKPVGVPEYLQDASASTVSILRMRAGTKEMSKKRCHKAMKSKHLWQLTTDDGARFLYFQDGPRRFIFVGASRKVKESKFQLEVARADRLRAEYFELKEGKVK